MKIIGDEEYDNVLFKNYYLSELMLVKKNGRKTFGDKYAIHVLLSEYLKEYGIIVTGTTPIFDLNNEKSNLEVRGIYIKPSFDIRNEEIIRQLYGYKNSKVNIFMAGGDDCSISFTYNLDDYSCVLEGHCWSSITNKMNFNTFSEMIDFCNDIDEYEKFVK